MGTARRLQRELAEIRDSSAKSYCCVEVSEINLLQWTVLLVPEREPYNKGAFKIKIDFPPDYPFRPPKVVFLTKIYHPNVDEHGGVCLDMILSEFWKPATRAEQVILATLELLNDPSGDNPLRMELAEEYKNDKKKFFKVAEEFTKKHAEKRPE